MVAYAYRAPAFQSGWLQKEASAFGRKTFHKRWFVLAGNELKYFKTETEEDTVPAGVIDLSKYIKVERDTTCKKSPFAFVLRPRDKEHRSYLIFAEKQEEMSLWIWAIQSRIDRGRDRDNDRSVLDKWLDKMELSSPSFESTRSKPSVMSPTNSTFSKTSSEFEAKDRPLRNHKSNESISSNGSASSATSSLYSGSTTIDSDPEVNYKERARQEIKDKLSRTASLPPILREQFNENPIIITSAPASPTFPNVATRRNIQMPIIPLESVVLALESIQAESWDTERARKRRSNSLPRFDCLKTKSGCVTPTFGNTVFF